VGQLAIGVSRGEEVDEILNFGHAGDMVAGLPDGMFWSIIGQEAIRHLVEVGNEVGLGIYIRNYEKLPNLPVEIAADAADPNRANVEGAATIEELAAKTGGWGFDGLELACWGDHFDAETALEKDSHIRERKDILARNNLKCFAISTHLIGQCVCDPIDERHRNVLPDRLWGDGKPEGVRQRAFRMVVDYGGMVVFSQPFQSRGRYSRFETHGGSLDLLGGGGIFENSNDFHFAQRAIC